MDAVQTIIETVRQAMEAAMPPALLFSGACVGVMMYFILTSFFNTKTRELEQGQKDFVPPSFLQLGNTKFPKGHDAKIIDFQLAREPALAKKQAAENARLNAFPVGDVKTATSVDLDNLYFKGEDNDNGPRAA